MHVLAGASCTARRGTCTLFHKPNVLADAFKYESLPLLNGKICTLPFIDNTLQYFAYMYNVSVNVKVLRAFYKAKLFAKSASSSSHSSSFIVGRGHVVAIAEEARVLKGVCNMYDDDDVELAIYDGDHVALRVERTHVPRRVGQEGAEEEHCSVNHSAMRTYGAGS